MSLGSCAECGAMCAMPELAAIADAIALGDWDAAIEAGLLRWNGCTACAAAQNIDIALASRMREVRCERLTALAARERYRARNTRLQRLQDERRQRQTESVSTNASGAPALAGAAAAALARALAKAKR